MTQTSVQIITRNGQVSLREIPLPDLAPGHVRVRVKYSAVSPGTELLGLGRSTGSNEEFLMGYQAAGVIEAVDPALDNLYKPGDQVACYGGPYVHHASHLDVPRQLVTPMPDGLDMRHAAFCGLASIALHGFRHSACVMGETVAVIGLGILGNLAAQCALAARCRVSTSELLPLRIKAAQQAGLDVAGNMDDLAAAVARDSADHGADAVLLAVQSADSALLTKSFELVRRLGRIVILGLSDAVVPREQMFSKEATIVVSRAAGWGRYSREYEFEGRDLPYEHARWTEHRNLEEVIRLMGLGALNIEPLITDEFKPDQAAQAYEQLRANPADHCGVLFDWSSVNA